MRDNDIELQEIGGLVSAPGASIARAPQMNEKQLNPEHPNNDTAIESTRQDTHSDEPDRHLNEDGRHVVLAPPAPSNRTVRYVLTMTVHY